MATDAGKKAAQEGLNKIAAEVFKGLTSFERTDGGGHPKGCNSIPDLGWTATGGLPLSDSRGGVTEWNSNLTSAVKVDGVGVDTDSEAARLAFCAGDGPVKVTSSQLTKGVVDVTSDGRQGKLTTTTPWVLELTTEVTRNSVTVKGAVRLEWEPFGTMSDDGTVKVDNSEQPQ